MPLPAVIHCTSPAPILPPPPLESRCSNLILSRKRAIPDGKNLFTAVFCKPASSRILGSLLATCAFLVLIHASSMSSRRGEREIPCCLVNHRRSGRIASPAREVRQVIIWRSRGVQGYYGSPQTPLAASVPPGASRLRQGRARTISRAPLVAARPKAKNHERNTKYVRSKW